MSIPIYDTLIKTGETIINKIWMDKDKKEQINFDKEQLNKQFQITLATMRENGELERIDMEYREAQAQRDYANTQFGTADILSQFMLGKVIMFGRASIRWGITGFCCWQAKRIIDYVLTNEVIASLASGKLSAGGTWLVTIIVCMVIGIPLFYVTGITVEKILKSRGVV